MSKISRIMATDEIELQTTGSELVRAIYVKTGRTICFADPYFAGAKAEEQGRMSWMIHGDQSTVGLSPRNIEHAEAKVLAVAQQILSMGGFDSEVIRNVPVCCPNCLTDMIYDLQEKKWRCAAYCDCY